MSSSVAMIEFPEELVARIDDEIGAEGRVAFVTEAAEAALRRHRFLQVVKDIKENGPIWKDEDHPELADGSYAYVRKLREEGEKRMQAVEAAWNRD
jgi:hypothetical protein